MLRTLAWLALLATSPVAVHAQAAAETDLFSTLKRHDARFFERGFNRCDFDFLERAVHPELDFYHDQSGYQTRQAFLDNTRRYVCPQSGAKPIRQVDEDSLQAFPLHRDGALYGAIHSGSHRFYLREPGKADIATSRARFTHLYLLEDGQWLLREVLSYDHADP